MTFVSVIDQPGSKDQPVEAEELNKSSVARYLRCKRATLYYRASNLLIFTAIVANYAHSINKTATSI